MSERSEARPLAIVCGGGEFPIEVARAARANGREPFIVGVVGSLTAVARADDALEGAEDLGDEAEDGRGGFGGRSFLVLVLSTFRKAESRSGVCSARQHRAQGGMHWAIG